MSCSNCYKRYNIFERKPFILYPCFHTFCRECICKLNSCPYCSLSIEDKKEITAILDYLNKSSAFNEQLNRIESTSQLNQLEIATKEKEIKSKSIQLENKIAIYTNKIIDLLMQQQNELILDLREQETKCLNQLKQCLKHQKQIDIKINATKSNISCSSSSFDLKDIQNFIQINLDEIKLIHFDFVFVENSDLIDKISSIGKVINLNPKKTIISNSSANNASVEAKLSGIIVKTSMNNKVTISDATTINSKQDKKARLSNSQIIKQMDKLMNQLKENIQSSKRIITTNNNSTGAETSEIMVKSAAIYNKIIVNDRSNATAFNSGQLEDLNPMIKKAIISNSPTITPIITTSIGENTPGITLKNQSNRSNVNSTQLDDHNHMIKRAKLFIINPTEYISSYDNLTQLLTKTAVSLSPQRKKDASYFENITKSETEDSANYYEFYN